MATETIVRKTCDVFGTQKDTGTYYVSVRKDGEKGELVREVTKDLGPRGLTRLLACIDKGVSKPGKEGENAS